MMQGWSLDTLQKYITWVRGSCAPTLEPAAEQLLVRYYQLQRRVADRQRARTTIRMLESLVRLSQVLPAVCAVGAACAPTAPRNMAGMGLTTGDSPKR